MRTIALLTSKNMLPDQAEARADAFEYDLQFKAFSAACRARVMRLEPVVWDAPARPWTDFDAVAIGTTWDYWEKAEAFLAALENIEVAGVPLYNAAATVRWNLDKGYLAELADRGVPTIPTLWRDAADAETISAAFDQLRTDCIVIKPRVGAGAERLVRLARGEPLPSREALPPAQCLVQPFLPSVAEKGETSLLFYDGVLSHALVKRPKTGDFRVQSIYGGREEVHQPTAEELAIAKAALAAAPADLLYARVDLVEGLDGRPALIELELIEPYHYPEQGRCCGYHFAAALDRYLTRSATDAQTARAESAAT